MNPKRAILLQALCSSGEYTLQVPGVGNQQFWEPGNLGTRKFGNQYEQGVSASTLRQISPIGGNAKADFCIGPSLGIGPPQRGGVQLLAFPFNIHQKRVPSTKDTPIQRRILYIHVFGAHGHFWTPNKIGRFLGVQVPVEAYPCYILVQMNPFKACLCVAHPPQKKYIPIKWVGNQGEPRGMNKSDVLPPPGKRWIQRLIACSFRTFDHAKNLR